MAKGYRGRANRVFSVAINRVEKALQYAYRDRKNKKRVMKTANIQRINSAARDHNINYSTLMNLQLHAGARLNKKVLANLAMYEPFSFKAFVDVIRMKGGEAKEALAAEKVS